MTQKQPIRNQFVFRVESRTTLARTLLGVDRLERAKAVGLLPADLDAIVRAGLAAKTYDGAQREDLAGQRAQLGANRASWEDFSADIDAFRTRAPLVVLDLAKEPATAPLAVWLDGDVFARFRIRTLPESETPAAEPAPAPARQRVARSDRYGFALSMQQLLGAILKPEREAIVAAFAARGLDRGALSDLHAAASAFAEGLGGAGRMQRAEATRLEAEAVAEQKRLWDACRRAIRAAVVGDPELERLYAAC